jgi:5'-nucleotidase
MLPKENLSVVYKDIVPNTELGTRTLRIIHFNDVYNVEGTKVEPVGGAARFATAIDLLNQVHPDHLIVFSGDAFSPSTCKSIKK